MPGFTSRDDIVNELTVNGKKDEYNFYKVSSAPEAAGVWHSLWTATGSPGAGANPATTPGTVYASDSSTPVAGSMYFPDRSTDLRYLLSFGAVATANCTLMLFDYLAGVSGISLASTGSKTINSGALTRYSGTAATLNEVWLETTTAGTTTAPIVNLNSYTSADGSTGLAGPNLTLPSTTMNVQSMVQLPMNAAEQGVLPPVALSMVRVGEDTGRLPHCFDRLAVVYDREVRESVKRAIGLHVEGWPTRSNSHMRDAAGVALVAMLRWRPAPTPSPEAAR